MQISRDVRCSQRLCEQSRDPWPLSVPCRCSRCSRWRRRRRAACSWTARRWAPAAARRAPARAPCSCTSVRTNPAMSLAIMSGWRMDSGSRMGSGSDCSGGPGHFFKVNVHHRLRRSGAAGLTNGVLLRTEVDHVTGQLSDTRTRFLGTRPPKVGAMCGLQDFVLKQSRHHPAPNEPLSWHVCCPAAAGNSSQWAALHVGAF